MPPIHLFMQFRVSTILLVLALIAICVLATCNGCLQGKIDKLKSNPTKETVKKTTDTVMKHDTTILFDHAPIPYQTETPRLAIQKVHDTLRIEGVDTIFVDTLAARYYATNYYRKDFKTQYGKVTTFDTVSRNKVIGSSTVPRFDIPEVTNTVTVTKTEVKHKAALYAGIDAYGSQKEFLSGAGLSLMYQSPRSLNWEIGSYFTSQQNLNFRISVKFPLTKK